MKISLIISIYKNVPFLKLVLESLQVQSYQDFEIIISEDGEDENVRQFVASYPFKQSYQHLTQKDDGWQKNKALNNAIRKSQGDWLIFIDGDCVLHKRFVEFHAKMADEQLILAGKRVKLSAETSNKLLSNPTLLPTLSRYLYIHFWKSGRYLEEALFIHPQGLLGWITRIRTMKHLKGCNMSFSKKALYAINGFDEDYTLPAIGEDVDILWRLQQAGYQLKSVRNMAVMYHLHHKESWVSQELNKLKMQVKRSNNTYICTNGIQKL